MSKLTLDEAIEYYINVATQRAVADEGMGVNDKWHETKFMTKKESEQVIADNRQLAEWLTELKELRSLKTDYVFFKAEAVKLLKAAVEGYSFIGHITKNYACPAAISCSACPMDEGKQCRIWEHADEALALIGEDGDTNG